MRRREKYDPPWWWFVIVGGVCVGFVLGLSCWQRAEAGPNTRVFEALNETVNLTEWQYQEENVGGGVIIDDSSLARNSIGRGIIATATATLGLRNATVNARFSGGVHNHVRFYVNPYTLNSTGGALPNRIIFQAYKRGTTANRANVGIVDLGTTWEIRVGFIDDDFTATPIAVDTIDATWHRVDLYGLAAAEPDGIVRVYIDGQLKFAADTLDTDGSKWDSLRVGFNTAASTTNSGWIAFDDIVVDTMPCAPPCGIIPVKAEYGLSSPFGGF